MLKIYISVPFGKYGSSEIQLKAWICPFGKGGVTETVFKKRRDAMRFQNQGADFWAVENKFGKHLHFGTHDLRDLHTPSSLFHPILSQSQYSPH